MPITTLNSQAIPADVIQSSDLDYPLTDFSSTGIDDNATSTAITIDASENVGIGITSPNALLHVSSSGNGEIEVERVGGALINLQAQSAVGVIGTDSNHDLRFKTNGSVRASITSAGNVGIGTTSPNYALDVVGAIRATNSGGSTIIANRTSNSGSVELQYNGTQTAQFSALSGGGVATYVGSTPSEAMRIDSSGKVGIATASPTHDLTVGSTSAADYVIALRGGVGGFLGWDDSANTTILQAPNTRSLSFRVNSDTFSAGTEAMRISSAGNVGINQSAPDAQLTLNPPNYTSTATGGMIKWKNSNNSGHSNIQSYFVSGQGTDINIGANAYINTSGAWSRWSTGLATSAVSCGRSGNISFITNTSSGNGITRAIVDSSGNLGLGTTAPSSYGGGFVVDDLGINIVTASSNSPATNKLSWWSDNNGISQNAYISVVNNGATTNTGEMVFYTKNASATLAERMRLDSSGDVGIGIAPASGYGRKLQVHSAAGGGASVHITDSSTGSTASDGLELITFGSAAYIWNREASFMSFGTSAAERMRIDSSGDVQIHGTSMLASSILSVDGSGETRNGVASKVNNNAYYAYVGINSNGANSFLVYGDGDVENTNNAYTGFSDARLKSNIVDASSQIDDIMAVQVRSYTLNETGATHIGVIAQELEASGMSGLVKTKDDGMKSVKYSILYMKAIKALQEAVTRIETLEAEVAALKGA